MTIIASGTVSRIELQMRLAGKQIARAGGRLHARPAQPLADGVPRRTPTPARMTAFRCRQLADVDAAASTEAA